VIHVEHWVLSGAITVSAEAVDTNTGKHRNVCFSVPGHDEAFSNEVDVRWRRSFAELEFQNQASGEDQHHGVIFG